jgi:hypothetical protein
MVQIFIILHLLLLFMVIVFTRWVRQRLETYSLTTVMDSDPQSKYQRKIGTDVAGQLLFYSRAR